MRHTKIFKILPIILLFFFFFPITDIKAAEPTFSFYPSGGTIVNPNQGFVVDILLDSGGEKLSSAKFTVLFDPRQLQLKKAERNNSLFVQYPEDESTLDNENGVVFLTGFTQSGTGTLYSTSGKPDVFARLTFEVLKEGQITLDWEFNGSNAPFDTEVYKDGSPPQNILITKPASATFLAGDGLLDPSTVDTAIPIDKYVLITGLVLVLFGGFMIFTRPGKIRKKTGTVIVYDE